MSSAKLHGDQQNCPVDPQIGEQEEIVVLKHQVLGNLLYGDR